MHTMMIGTVTAPPNEEPWIFKAATRYKVLAIITAATTICSHLNHPRLTSENVLGPRRSAIVVLDGVKQLPELVR